MSKAQRFEEGRVPFLAWMDVADCWEPTDGPTSIVEGNGATPRHLPS